MNTMKKVMTIKKYSALCLLVVVLGICTKCAEEFVSPDPVTGNTLVDLAATDTTLQILTAALAKTGIGISLDNINSGQHTVFAPSDSAFRIYFQPIIGGGPGDVAIIAYIDALSSTSNPTLAAFTARLQYHIVSSEALSDDIHNSQVFTTINTARLSLSSGSTIFINGNIAVNGAKTRVLDIDGSNGVIHVINRFMTAIATASVVTNTLGITINYATAPPTVTVGATAGNNYDILSNAIKKTGLATTLRPNVATANLPDFTIFAPTDAALVTFLDSLSGGGGTVVNNEATAITYVNGLESTDPKFTYLTDVVKYHVASGRVLTTDLSLNQDVTTLLPTKTFKVKAVGTIVLEDAKTAHAIITSSNTLTNAGVLQQLNKVMRPQ